MIRQRMPCPLLSSCWSCVQSSVRQPGRHYEALGALPRGKRLVGGLVVALVSLLLSGCGQEGTSAPDGNRGLRPAEQQETLRDFLFNRSDEAVIGSVNKYLWNATLDVLSFLPVRSADPFTGTIIMDFGRPPGGEREYRATVLISDPALDARSFSLAMQTRDGPVDAATLRTVENAVMTRARQRRVQDSRY